VAKRETGRGISGCRRKRTVEDPDAHGGIVLR
jgi:hypothetical protein